MTYSYAMQVKTKKAIVDPIVGALIHADISVWYDEAEIKSGDSITQKVKGRDMGSNLYP